MQIAGIVAEYNPFHNGHKFQIDSLKKSGFSHIIVAQSGNFVQRGEPAIFDKWTRASAALSCGADVVLEIPTCFCLSTAEKYARSAVSLLNSCGVVNSLCFGSESGDLDALSHVARRLLDGSLDNDIKTELKTGVTYAAARESAMTKRFGEDAGAILSTPNDILGVEYLKALTILNSPVKPLAIKRQGALHDDDTTRNGIASASHIRKMLKKNQKILDFVPEIAHNMYMRAPKHLAEIGERAMLWQLRQLTREDWNTLPDVSEGLGDRLYNAAREAVTLDRLCTLTKTKRYTLARIRRLVLSAALGIFTYSSPPFLRVLGFSQSGEELLTKMKKNSALPLVTSFRDACNVDLAAKEYFETEAKYTDLFYLLKDPPAKAGEEFRKSVIRVSPR